MFLVKGAPGCSVITLLISFLQLSLAQIPRIVSDWNATLGQFPYFASLHINGKHICGGAILNDHCILTAAHCIADYKYEVVVGSIHREQGDKYKVSEIIVHEKFNLSQSNLAILKTEKQIHFNTNVQPIKLHSAYVEGNENVVTCGFGRPKPTSKENSDVLKALDLKTLSHQECQPKNSFVSKELVCTVADRDQGLCMGDSGDPLTLGGKLVGVATWGSVYRCRIPRKTPDLFTRVSSHLDWIKKNSLL